MDFRVDMFVRQQWTEPRLHMPDAIFEDGEDYVTLPPEFFDKLWQPDPYIINSKVSEIAMLTHQFSSVTLYRNRTVRYSARMHAIVACQMEFQLYPMDIQLCPVYIESWRRAGRQRARSAPHRAAYPKLVGRSLRVAESQRSGHGVMLGVGSDMAISDWQISYNDHKLRLRWGEDGVSVNPALKLLQYNVGTPLELREMSGYRMEKDGNFSRLIAYFRFERQIGHHLIQTFAPSSLVVLLSWCGFWLGLDAIPGRVTLLVTCMLTLVTMFTGLKDIPPVAYVKALDVWMAACMLFVFAALVEFVVVKVLDVQHQREQREHRGSHPLCISAAENGDPYSQAWEITGSGSISGVGARWRKVAVSCPGSAPGSPGSGSPDSPPHVLLLPPPRPAPTGGNAVPVWIDRFAGGGLGPEQTQLWRRIDRMSRLIFPALFIMFIMCYWPILLLKAYGK
ncbi:glycine receptor subunit alpha-1 isoform X4 [Frankliniella occidentalis]|nr:glycine receptor subunit alpha-1 isoform X4 [Frankliniella occidentalis]XP_052122071.1 glycine receptor subunit alpha-1 isoform X4 [Frankliniella occidentalis]XP_052122072.1 glycine receptor subunit alpha-1 isoform X4 [Frankliniella occidentalis]XP_052122073.1 glycine receptor subunit alpha-1 isoform X4 [Frankliniella occidentalis]